MTVNPMRAGLVLGLFLALFHACWAALVAAGIAQPLMDFIFWAHFITPPWHIEHFTPVRAAVLVGLTFMAGLVSGAAGGLLWNRFGNRA